jgi:hypothetical protein
MTKPVLLQIQQASLRGELEASLADAGYAIERARTPEDVVAALKEEPKLALIAETRRDGFAQLLRSAHRLRPGMPIHMIDGAAVFCFHPLSRQPSALIDAILAGGVSISQHLLRHTLRLGARPPKTDSFLV